jgi:hypothetical protein
MYRTTVAFAAMITFIVVITAVLSFGYRVEQAAFAGSPSPSPIPTVISGTPEPILSIPSAVNELSRATIRNLLKGEDQDGDGVSDADDNCVRVPNADQKDRNKNGIGDACEPRGPWTDEEVIDEFVRKEEKRLDAEENRDGRLAVKVDMNGDGRKDVVVIYMLEGFGGSNRYLSYAALFLAQRRGTVRLTSSRIVGGKNIRAIEEVLSSHKGKVVFSTLEYTHPDASCCPSRKGQLALRYSRGRLLIQSPL